MKPLTTRQKISAIRALLRGGSVLAVSRQFGISSGSIGNIFSEFRQGIFAPAGDVIEQVDELRELAVNLKKANLSPGQCLEQLLPDRSFRWRGYQDL
jgi:transposase-like protein